ncbi:TPA: ATP-dependent endonuclease, partial [Streptococcus suis]
NIKKVAYTPDSELEPILGINLQIWIQYSEEDSYQNIQPLMMDLNPDNNYIILDFSYIVPISRLHDLNTEISNFSDDFSKFESFMKKSMSKFFEMQINSRGYNPDIQKLTEEKSDLLEMKDIHKL